MCCDIDHIIVTLTSTLTHPPVLWWCHCYSGPLPLPHPSPGVWVKGTVQVGSGSAWRYLGVYLCCSLDTVIPEDSHLQATFAKIHRHLDLLRDYKCKVLATLQSLLILAKLPWYMDVFTQILNMRTSTKVTPSSEKNKEKEKEVDPLPILSEWHLLPGNSTNPRRRSHTTMHIRLALSSAILEIPSSSSNSSRGEIGHCSSSSKEASRRRRPTMASIPLLARLSKMQGSSAVPMYTPTRLPPPPLLLPPPFLMIPLLSLPAPTSTHAALHICITGEVHYGLLAFPQIK